MDKQEKLRDQFEEALFATLMEEFAKEEGQAALEENEALKNDPNAEIPKEIDQRCQKAIAKHFSAAKAKTVGHTSVRILQKIIIVAALLILFCSAAFAISPTLRVTAYNFIVHFTDEATEYHLAPEESYGEPDVGSELTANWLPDGFELDVQEVGYIYSTNTYKNADGMQIVITKAEGTDVTFAVDNEVDMTKSIVIQGWDAVLTKKDSIYTVTWGDEDAVLILSIVADGIGETDVIQIAENLDYN